MTRGALKIYCDGGARGNPGPAAAAFVVFDGARTVYQDSKYLGKSTNNRAEYGSVLMALVWLAKNFSKLKFGRVHFYLDSELVVQQLAGKYKIKSKNLKPLALKARDIEKKIDAEIYYKSVPRKKNKLADYLVNKTLDENV